LDVDYRLCITWIIHQQLWGYKVEEKLYLGVREQKWLNTTGLDHPSCSVGDSLFIIFPPINSRYTYKLHRGSFVIAKQITNKTKVWILEALVLYMFTICIYYAHNWCEICIKLNSFLCLIKVLIYGWGTVQFIVRFLAASWVFSTSSRPVLRLTQPPIQWHRGLFIQE
jgi:hypothetical protein